MKTFKRLFRKLLNVVEDDIHLVYDSPEYHRYMLGRIMAKKRGK
jgi:hypothetical protein